MRRNICVRYAWTSRRVGRRWALALGVWLRGGWLPSPLVLRELWSLCLQSLWRWEGEGEGCACACACWVWEVGGGGGGGRGRRGWGCGSGIRALSNVAGTAFIRAILLLEPHIERIAGVSITSETDLMTATVFEGVEQLADSSGIEVQVWRTHEKHGTGTDGNFRLEFRHQTRPVNQHTRLFDHQRSCNPCTTVGGAGPLEFLATPWTSRTAMTDTACNAALPTRLLLLSSASHFPRHRNGATPNGAFLRATIACGTHGFYLHAGSQAVIEQTVFGNTFHGVRGHLRHRGPYHAAPGRQQEQTRDWERENVPALSVSPCSSMAGVPPC